MLDDAQVAVVLTTPEHEAALEPLARQAGADLRVLQPQACAPLSPHNMSSKRLPGCARVEAHLFMACCACQRSVGSQGECDLCMQVSMGNLHKVKKK